MKGRIVAVVLAFSPCVLAGPTTTKPSGSATSAPAPSASSSTTAPNALNEASVEAFVAEAEALAGSDHSQRLAILTANLQLLKLQRQELVAKIDVLKHQRDATTDAAKKSEISSQIAALQSQLDAIDRNIATINAEIAAIYSAEDTAHEAMLRQRIEDLKKTGDALASNAEVRDAAGKLVTAERRATIVAQVARARAKSEQAERALAMARDVPKLKK